MNKDLNYKTYIIISVIVIFFGCFIIHLFMPVILFIALISPYLLIIPIIIIIIGLILLIYSSARLIAKKLRKK